MLHIVAFSGGKDSTALVIYLQEKNIDFEAVFCDTQWEHDLTYKYIAYINRKLLNGKLRVLKSDKYDGMEDLVVKKGRVPSHISN